MNLRHIVRLNTDAGIGNVLAISRVLPDSRNAIFSLKWLQ